MFLNHPNGRSSFLLSLSCKCLVYPDKSLTFVVKTSPMLPITTHPVKKGKYDVSRNQYDGLCRFCSLAWSWSQSLQRPHTGADDKISRRGLGSARSSLPCDLQRPTIPTGQKVLIRSDTGAILSNVGLSTKLPPLFSFLSDLGSA